MNDTERAIKTLEARKKFVADINLDAHIAYNLAIQALEKQIELNDYLNTLRKNKKYQIYDILSEFALEVENETNNK